MGRKAIVKWENDYIFFIFYYGFLTLLCSTIIISLPFFGEG